MKFYFSRIGRKNMAKNRGLHQPDILGHSRNELRLIHDIRQVRLATALDGSQTEEEQRADRREDYAKRSEHEQHFFANRQLFKFVHMQA
jgi:hypothetical protein